MTSPPRSPAPRPRLAILSHSSGEYDARSLRVARSAVAAGYDVTIYARLHPGLSSVEEHEGFRLVRAEFDWRLAIPGLRAGARRRSAVRTTNAAGLQPRAADPHVGLGGRGAGDEEASAGRGARGGPLLAPMRLGRRVERRFSRRIRRWRSTILMFPLRPMGWAVALESVVEPADVWHGMWAGSLPALKRMRRLHGGRTVYDSRDVYMHSRDFARLEWPLRPILAHLERRWARGADRVLTVNDAYAGLIATQLGVPRPAVVINTPERWTPPVPAPDRIRETTGVPADTLVALYQGKLTTDRGIEQAMEAILQCPGTVLALLGFGEREARLRTLAASAPYQGKVYVLPAVPPSELLAWTASADVMVMPIQPTSRNHELTTPQKLWEAIAAGVPVVASDLPGMADVVRASAIGVVCDPTSPAAIAASIRTVLGQPEAARAAMRAHVLAVAHERYTWERQLATLFGLYEELGFGPVIPPPDDAPASIVAVPGTATQTEGPRLRFLSVAPTGRAPAGDASTTRIVLDTAWTPREEDAAGLVLLRDVVEEIMRRRDLIADAARTLDDWAEASGISSRMVHEGVSFWYGARLGCWMWVLDQILWLGVLDHLLAMHPGTRVLELDAGSDALLVAAARQVAARDGLVLEGAGALAGTGAAGAAVVGKAPSGPGQAPARERGAGGRVRGRGLVGRIRRRLRPSALERQRRLVMARVDALASDPARRLLVVQAHARQQIETPDGPRQLNVYVGPIQERLRGSALDPMEVDIRSALADHGTSARLDGPDGDRYLPSDVLPLVAPGVDDAGSKAAAAAMAEGVAALQIPMMVAGVDLGPALSARVAGRIATTHARSIRDTARIRSLLRRLHPAGILLADEYHRQDWLAAALAESVPVAAVQHGVIYRWHNGYMHRTRPDELRLPGRTYVFGPWERDLLVDTSVYEPAEVVVGGSPRLDHLGPVEPDTAAVREELGIADGDRMVVLSGTWGAMYRRFHYPIALAHLFARPLERVHLVVKLHPSERDEGPYRRIVEGMAAAGGFDPPPITVVKDVDLYRLLAAADAHLGIHSTVLTEAVVTGTPNLLATGLVAADLLGYVDARVAVPVETPEDLVTALDMPRSQISEPANREAFLRTHFEPGDASARIANDLLGWLA